MTTHPTLTLSLRYKLKAGARDAWLGEINAILNRCAKEPEFITGILHQGKDDPDEFMLFEIWKGTYDEFIRVQGAKEYRQAYLKNSKQFIENVDVRWGVPTQAWGTGLLH